MSDWQLAPVLRELTPDLGLYTIGEIEEQPEGNIAYIALWANVPEGTSRELREEAEREPIGKITTYFDDETKVVTFVISMETDFPTAIRYPVLEAINTKNGEGGFVTLLSLTPERPQEKLLSINGSSSIALSEKLLSEEGHDLLVSLLHYTLARFAYESWNRIGEICTTVYAQ